MEVAQKTFRPTLKWTQELSQTQHSSTELIKHLQGVLE